MITGFHECILMEVVLFYTEKENRGTGQEKENPPVQHLTAQPRQSPHLRAAPAQRDTAPGGLQTVHTHKSPW